MDEAMENFNEMIDMENFNEISMAYMCMIEGYLNHGDSVETKELVTEMKNMYIHHRFGRTQYL